MKKWIYLLLLFFSPELLAGPFDPVATDKSRELLGVIFGSNIGDIYLGGKANPVLSDMMEKFNFIIVVIGTVVVSYVAIMSTINTAQEGTAMGKKWSAIWIPMRSIAGMALMVPAPSSGYSMIQVTVMWIILQGIGAADSLWEIALEGLASGASASAGTSAAASVVSKELEPAAKTLAQDLLNAVTCMESLKLSAQSQENQDANTWLAQKAQQIKMYSTQEKDTPTLTGTADASKKTDTRVSVTKGAIYFGVDDDSDPTHKALCGKLNIVATVKGPDLQSDSYNAINDQDLMKASQSAYDIKITTVDNMVSTLSSLAESIVDGQAKVDLTGNTPLENTGYANLAKGAYVDVMSTLVSNQGNISEAVKKTIDAGKKNGWVSAGSFYFVFNRTMIANLLPTYKELIEKVDSDTGRIPICDPAICLPAVANKSYGWQNDNIYPNYFAAKSINSAADLKNLSNALAAAAFYMSHDVGTTAPTLDLPAPPGTDTGAAGQVLGAIQEAGVTILEDLTKMINDAGGGDPLLAHAIFGRNIMIVCEGTVIAVIIISLAMMAVGAGAAALPFGLGTIGVAIGMLAQLLLFLLALMLPIVGMLWTFGAILALYCPFIPFMIFTVAVLGWFLTVVESILAAPIIALGLVVPSGDEMGKLETALMLLANIFLRPLLLVFGFILAGNVYRAIVELIDFGMADVLNTITPVVSTPFSIVVLIGVYVFFVLSVTNTSFSLIYAVPDKILRWMGGPHESTDTSAMNEVKGQVHGLASATSQQGSAIGSKMGEKGMGDSEKGGGAVSLIKGSRNGSSAGGWLPGGKKK